MSCVAQKLISAPYEIFIWDTKKILKIVLWGGGGVWRNDGFDNL